MSHPGYSSGGLAFHQLGELSAPVVVLLGSYGQPLAAWDDSGLPQRIAASGRRVIWYAARGVWPSAVPPLPWQTSNLVDDLVGLLDDVEVAKASIIGYSFGGFTAELFAHTHPDRATNVVLVASAGQPSAMAWAKSADELSFAATSEGPPSLGRQTSLLISLARNELGNPDVVDRWAELIAQLPSAWSLPAGRWGQAQVSHGWIDGGHHQVIGWPTQVGLGVIAFEHDVLFTVGAARDYVATRPSALLRVIPGIAHGGLLTAPYPAGSVLLEVLDRLGS